MKLSVYVPDALWTAACSGAQDGVSPSTLIQQALRLSLVVGGIDLEIEMATSAVRERLALLTDEQRRTVLDRLAEAVKA